MPTEIVLTTQGSEVSDLILHLLDVTGVDVQIKEEPRIPPSENTSHPAYSLDASMIVVIGISVASLATSALSLATALLEYLRNRKVDKTDKGDTAKAPTITINGIYIVHVSDDSRAEDIATYLQDNPISRIDLR